MADSAPVPLTSSTLSSRHGFFTREGGVSSGLYASLQCGFGAKEDARENVVENRARAARALGARPEDLVTAYQAHTATVVTVDAPWSPENAPEADGLATARPGVALGVLAADCAPVLFEDPAARVIGACHAGWRGALGGVLEATLDAMTALGARRARIVAAVGPSIGPKAYEVGPEYRARFVDAAPSNDRFFRDAAAPDKSLFDLPAYVVSRLSLAGVGVAVALKHCTVSEESLFFSNRRATRRGEPDYGRLLSAIVLEANP